MSIVHSHSLLTSALTSSINVNTIQQIEALLNQTLKLLNSAHSHVSGNSLRTLTAFCLVARFLFLTTAGASRLDRSCTKFGLGNTPDGADMKGESATHYTRMYFTLKNLWLMKYHHISGIFSCKYTRRYLMEEDTRIISFFTNSFNLLVIVWDDFFLIIGFFFHTYGLHSFSYSF